MDYEVLLSEWSERNEIDLESAPVKNKYWWVCDKGHEYQATLGNRKYQSTGCPYCKSKLPSKDNNLKVKYPEISNEWDYQNNKGNPESYLPRSNKKAHWICKYGHSWYSTIHNRTSQNNNCPICFRNESWCENFIFSTLGQIFDVDKHRDPELDIYIKSLNIGIEYDGYYHKFRYDVDINKNKWASLNLKLLIRVREKYLPELPIFNNVLVIDQKDSSRKSTIESIKSICDILGVDHQIIDFNVPVDSKIRNKDLPDDIISSWSKNNKIDISKAMKTHKYFWICDNCGSEYESEFRSRLSKNRCPYCASQKVNSKNCISSTHPYILKYLSKNNDVDPNSVTFGTGRKLKFILNSKEYETTPRNFNRRLVNLHGHGQSS